eukprot:6185442-Pleurochrysis_carterae.AAC.1
MNAGSDAGSRPRHSQLEGVWRAKGGAQKLAATNRKAMTAVPLLAKARARRDQRRCELGRRVGAKEVRKRTSTPRPTAKRGWKLNV